MQIQKNPDTKPLGDEVDIGEEKQLQYRSGFTILFYPTFQLAKQEQDLIKEKSLGAKQLSLVIKEEGNMDDPDLLAIADNVKIYAGEAWTLIQTRRQEGGWYK